jgi:hypothetical protein
MDTARVALALLVVALAPALAGAQSDASPAEPPSDPFLPFLATGPAAPIPASPALGTELEVLLKDGQRLRGRFLGRGPGGVTLEVEGGRITLPATAIRASGAPSAEGTGVAASPGRARDSNRTRYLYSPSGFMLKQGEGYLSQTELLLTSVAYGATDWLTLQAGTVIPALAYDPLHSPAIFAVKAGWSPAPLWHLAGGFQTFVLPDSSGTVAAGFLFGTVTWGTEDLHFGISAGPPFALSSGTTDLGNVLVSVSANWRAFSHGALVTENWIVTGGGQTHVVASGAYRFISDRIAVDVGLIFSDVTNGIPIPWLDFTWHWPATSRSPARP